MWIRTLAASYAGKGVVGEIFTVEMGAVGLQNALCAIAKHSQTKGEGGHLEHCSALYDRLRGYRNYYIHGTVFTTEYTDGRPAAGFTFGKTAKGQIKTYSARVEAPQIQAVADQCYELGLFARQIFHHLHGGPKPDERPPLPDKPPLPPVADKNRPWPQLPSSQPQASGE
jgi:hypothetical protein